MSVDCTKIVTDVCVKVEQHKRKAIFKNPDHLKYEVTEIDNCLIKDGIRCDYLVSEVGSASVLVELKGSDVSHACKQLLVSVEHHSVKPLLKGKVGFLVVCSRYPRFDSFVVKAKQRCAKQYKAGFHIICAQCELDIKRVAEIDGPI